jgi:predicted XRE-type DNA-binding protein
VFVDLGFPDAAERQAKLRLAYVLNQVLAQRGRTRAAAARLLGLSGRELSALNDYKLSRFPVGRLMIFLTVAGRDVEIVIKNKPRSRPSARITVVAT